MSSGYPTLKKINSNFYKDDIFVNHKSFMSSESIPIKEEYDDLPTLCSKSLKRVFYVGVCRKNRWFVNL